MEVNNRINSTFGPAGVFSGYVLLVFGIATITSWAGLILLLIGAFFAFSYSGTTVDKEKNRFRQFTKLFGLIKVGDWEDLNYYDKITILKNNSTFRVFSRSNRSMEYDSKGYLIYMFGDDIRFKVPLAICKTKEDAINKSKKISQTLGFKIVDISTEV